MQIFRPSAAIICNTDADKEILENLMLFVIYKLDKERFSSITACDPEEFNNWWSKQEQEAIYSLALAAFENL